MWRHHAMLNWCALCYTICCDANPLWEQHWLLFKIAFWGLIYDWEGLITVSNETHSIFHTFYREVIMMWVRTFLVTYFISWYNVLMQCTSSYTFWKGNFANNLGLFLLVFVNNLYLFLLLTKKLLLLGILSMKRKWVDVKLPDVI